MSTVYQKMEAINTFWAYMAENLPTISWDDLARDIQMAQENSYRPSGEYDSRLTQTGIIAANMFKLFNGIGVSDLCFDLKLRVFKYFIIYCEEPSTLALVEKVYRVGRNLAATNRTAFAGWRIIKHTVISHTDVPLHLTLRGKSLVDEPAYIMVMPLIDRLEIAIGVLVKRLTNAEKNAMSQQMVLYVMKNFGVYLMDKHNLRLSARLLHNIMNSERAAGELPPQSQLHAILKQYLVGRQCSICGLHDHNVDMAPAIAGNDILCINCREL